MDHGQEGKELGPSSLINEEVRSTYQADSFSPSAIEYVLGKIDQLYKIVKPISKLCRCGNQDHDGSCSDPPLEKAQADREPLSQLYNMHGKQKKETDEA